MPPKRTRAQSQPQSAPVIDADAEIGDDVMLDSQDFEEIEGYRYLRTLMAKLPSGSRALYMTITNLIGGPGGYDDLLKGPKEEKPKRAPRGKVADALEGATEAAVDAAAGPKAKPVKRHEYKSNYVKITRNLGPEIRAQMDADRAKIVEFLDGKIADGAHIPVSRAILNIRVMSEEFGLTADEGRLMELIYVLKTAEEFGMTAQMITEDSSQAKGQYLMAGFLGVKPAEVNKMLDMKARIRALYLIEEGDDDFDDNSVFPSMEFLTREMIRQPYLITAERIREEYCGKALTTELDLEDFRFVIPQLDQVERMIRNAIENKMEGVSILLYGPPGTGKTTFAKAIATKLGYSIHGADVEGAQTEMSFNRIEDPKELSSGLNRLRSLRRSLLMLGDQEKTMILTDEFVDLFSRTDDGKAKPISKQLMQDLVEKNKIPVIYTTNETGEMPESVLDRMIPIYVGVPPTLVRRNIWALQAKRQNADLSEADILQMAREFVAPPRVIEYAIREAKLREGGIDTMRASVRAKAFLRTGDEHSFDMAYPLHKKFREDFITASTQDQASMNDLVTTMRDKEDAQWCVLITGPDQSGKTSLARFYLEKMQRNHEELDLKSFKDNPFELEGLMPKVLQMVRSTGSVLVLKHVEVLQDKPEVWQKIVRMLITHPAPIIMTGDAGLKIDSPLRLMTTAHWKTGPLKEDKIPEALTHFFALKAANDDNAEDTASAFAPLRQQGGVSIGDFALAATLGERRLVASAPQVVQMIQDGRAFAAEAPGRFKGFGRDMP
jgi:tRNA A37 threonylcarbamoyladenosine biosynthesis protein TsaE